jgi:hypothetical protein
MKVVALCPSHLRSPTILATDEMQLDFDRAGARTMDAPPAATETLA